MSRKDAYLTIDDGPVEDFERRIDFLESKDIKAIWFCEGRKLEKFSREATQAVKRGHIIGNHSYSHPYFSEISLGEAERQISRTDTIIDNIYSGADISRPIKVFRFPFLDRGDGRGHLKCDLKDEHVKSIQKILENHGYEKPKFEGIKYKWYYESDLDKCVDVACTYDSFDWCLEDGVETYGYHDLTSILDRIDENDPEDGRGLNYPGSNEIIMMHSWIPINAFRTIIEKILSKGINFKLPNL